MIGGSSLALWWWWCHTTNHWHGIPTVPSWRYPTWDRCTSWYRLPCGTYPGIIPPRSNTDLWRVSSCVWWPCIIRIPFTTPVSYSVRHHYNSNGGIRIILLSSWELSHTSRFYTLVRVSRTCCACTIPTGQRRQRQEVAMIVIEIVAKAIVVPIPIPPSPHSSRFFGGRSGRHWYQTVTNCYGSRWEIMF